MSIALILLQPNNKAFHNLCEKNTYVPPNVSSLLGLSLNFVPTPHYSSSIKHIDLKRFEEDFKRIIMFSGRHLILKPDHDEKEFWSKNLNFEPDPIENVIISSRYRSFIKRIKLLYSNKVQNQKCLLPQQEQALKWLLEHPDLVVCSADKNLGPCLIEAHKYCYLAYKDHLQCPITYKKLDQSEACLIRNNTVRKIDFILKLFEASRVISDKQIQYIRSKNYNINWKTGAFGRMYLLPKLHKNPPMKTRAIISYCGSFCEPIAKYCDIQLQKLIACFPTFICKNSHSLLQAIQYKNWTGFKMTTADASSMYTNIHWSHAKEEIIKFYKSDLGKNHLKESTVNINVLVELLEITMQNNIFTFGDSYYIQKTGTAMGAPCAPPYANLFFALHENVIINKFKDYIGFYKRYIDDVIVFWNVQIENTLLKFDEFKSAMNSYGSENIFLLENNLSPLTWNFEEFSNQITFLDLNIKLKPDGFIHSNLHVKELNLHMYLPSHSCHQHGILKGLIFGEIVRAKNLCTDQIDCYKHINELFNHLIHRGHRASFLKPIFLDGIKKKLLQSSSRKYTEENIESLDDTINFHCKFNPGDPPFTQIHKLFEEHIIEPCAGFHINTLEANKPNSFVTLRKIRPVPHKQRNLRTILSPTRQRFSEVFSVDQYINNTCRTCP